MDRTTSIGRREGRTLSIHSGWETAMHEYLIMDDFSYQKFTHQLFDRERIGMNTIARNRVSSGPGI